MKLQLAIGISILLLCATGKLTAQAPQKPALAKATFAGGCFWCIEAELEKLPGVVSVTSGYTGGKTKNPTYEQVSSGGTGHAEAVEVMFDPAKVSYEKLVEVYWKNIDPTVTNGQFCDHGEQYRTVIFFHDDAQRQVAEETKKQVEQYLKTSVPTEIVKAGVFYPAEEYHQNYAEKNPLQYGMYHSFRKNCGRADLLEKIWAPIPGQAKEK
jgi:peptide-methionine (S)-S-oxide reductase